MGVLDNPVLNPFYQSHGDKEPDNLVKEAERRNGARYGSFQEAQDEDKTEVADDSSLSSAEHITDDYQEGLQKVEAVAIVWTKWSLVSAYAWYDLSMSPGRSGMRLMTEQHLSSVLHTFATVVGLLRLDAIRLQRVRTSRTGLGLVGHGLNHRWCTTSANWQDD